MRNALASACFTVLTSLMLLGLATPARAQVIISGEVSSYTEPTPNSTVAPSPYVGAPAPEQRFIHHSDSVPALWVPGLILLIGGYAVNITGLAYLLADEFGPSPSLDWYLYGLIPLVGPFLQLTEEPRRAEGVSIVTGIAQVGGLVLTILGFALRDEWDEPVYVFDESDPRSPTLAFNLGGAPGGGAVGTVTLNHF